MKIDVARENIRDLAGNTVRNICRVGCGEKRTADLSGFHDFAAVQLRRLLTGPEIVAFPIQRDDAIPPHHIPEGLQLARAAHLGLHGNAGIQAAQRRFRQGRPAQKIKVGLVDAEPR